MRRKGLLLKLGFLGLGLVSSSAMVIGTLANVNNESVAMAEDTGDFYQISYANGELQLLLSATPASYVHLNRTAIVNAKNALFTAVSNALADKIDILSSFGADGTVGQELTYLEWTPRYAYTPSTGLDAALLEKVVAASLMTGGVADIEKVDAFNNDPTGSYSTIVSYYADRYADAHPEYDRDDVYADIAGVVQDKAQEMTTAAYIANGYQASEVPTAATNVVTALNNTVATGVEVELPDVTQMMSIIQDTMEEDSSITVASFVTNLGQDAVADELKDVLKGAEANDIQEFMINVQPSVVADFIVATDITKVDINEVLDSVGLPKLLTIAQTIDVEGIKTILQSVPGYTSSDLQQFVKDNVAALSITDIFNALEAVKVNNHTVLENKQFNKSGIKAVLAELPRPSEIANWSDDQMRITWNISVETSLGDMELPLTVGFFGDCTFIRTVCEYIGKAFDISYTDGTLKVSVRAGEYLAKFARKVINSGLVPEALLKEAFEFLTSDVQGMYDIINTKLLSDIIADLQSIDYSAALATVYSADFLNNLFHTSRFNDANMDRIVDAAMKVFRIGNKISFSQFVNIIEKVKDLTDSQEHKLENLFNKFVSFMDRVDARNINSTMLRALLDEADDSVTNQTVYNAIAKLSRFEDYYNRAQNLLTKVFNKLPDNYKDKKIMNAYQGNGLWSTAASFNFDAHDILVSLSSSYGETIYNALESVVGNIPTSLKVELSFEAKDVYSVTYDYGNGETLTGALPSGVEVATFALQDTVNGMDIIRWVDENGDEVVMMPQRDVTIYAVTDFEVEASDDVVKTYDGQEATISVTATPAGNFTYQWMKNGVAVPGATLDTFTVKNVADSGSYTCVVTRDDGMEHESDAILVAIDSIKIDVSNVQWNYNGAFEYDGNAHSVAIDSATLPAGVGVVYTGQRNGTAKGAYKAEATLYSLYPNYELVGETHLVLNWSIGELDITVNDVDWDYTSAFTYDGTLKTVNVDDQNLPEHVVVISVTGNTATNAGEYTAKVVLGVDSNNYTINGGSEAEFELTWTINKATVNVAGVTWNEATFVYDANAHEVVLNPFTGEELVNIAYTGTRKATNVGQYTARATITLKDSENYTLVGSGIVSHDWEITQASISITDAAWNYTAPFVYNGQVRSVAIKADTVPAGVGIQYTGTRSATNVGTYSATATFVAQNANYKIVGTTTMTLSWKIEQQEIDISMIAWDYSSPFVYSGYNHVVALDPTTVPDHVLVTYSGSTSAKNAGNYVANATFAAENANYKLVGNTSTSLNWTITKAEIDVSGVTSNYVNAFTYDGKVKSVDVNYATVPAYVDAEITGQVNAINAGNYVAIITLTAEDNNHVLVGNTIITVNWTINKVAINVSGVTWGNTSFVYTGKAATVTVNNLPKNVSVEYTGNKAVNAGSYTATATLSADSANYYLVGDDTLTTTWTIAKAKVTMGDVEWDSPDSITYDGNEHTVSVIAGYIPEGVVVTYTGTRTAKEVGSYQVTATFSLTDALAVNYELTGKLTSKFAWEIVSKIVEVTDFESAEQQEGNPNGVVKSNIVIDGVLHVELDDASGLANLAWNRVTKGQGAKVYVYYDVYFVDGNGARIATPKEARFTVQLLLTKEAAARQAKYMVTSIGEDNSVKKVDASREGDYMVFQTGTLGHFAIIELTPMGTPWWVLGLVIAAGAVIAVETYVIIVKTKKAPKAKK